jgi:hypothetical protein
MLDNAGTAVWRAGGLTIANGAVWNNLPGSVFDVQNDVKLNGYLGGTFNNQGTFRKSAGSGTTTIGVSFTNQGTFAVRSGMVRFVGDYTQTGGDTLVSAAASLAVGGLVNILAGTLSGSGTVNGNVRNAGQFSPGDAGVPGVLTINGNYTQTAHGTLNIEISGTTTAGTDYDQLVVTGQATLDDTLNVSLANGFTSNLDDRFQVLIFGSRNGNFTVKNGLDLGNGLRFDPQYDAGSLTLVTTAGNAPPPPGGAGSNGSHHFPVLEQAALSTLPVDLAGANLWQAGAAANNGNKAGDGLDMFFQLMAERAENLGKRLVRLGNRLGPPVCVVSRNPGFGTLSRAGRLTCP